MRGPYDLILCNPPYVNAQSMAALPAEYRAEPALALAGGDDGMDLVRRILRDAPAHLSADGVLVLEIGHERWHFERAFPRAEVGLAAHQRRRRPGAAGDARRARQARRAPRPEPMLVLNDISLRRGVKVVLDHTSVTLQPGEKIGLVGRNGAGKSSLFALLTGKLQADAGDVQMPPRWRARRHGRGGAGHARDRRGATDFVLEGDTPLMLAQQRLAAAEAADDGHAIAEAHHAIQDAGGFDARARAQAC